MLRAPAASSSSAALVGISNSAHSASTSVKEGSQSPTPSTIVQVPLPPIPPSQKENPLRSFLRCLIAAQACGLSKCREASRILKPRASGKSFGSSTVQVAGANDDPLQQASFVAEQDELSAFIGADSPPWSGILPNLSDLSLHRLLSIFEDLIAVEEACQAWKESLFRPHAAEHPDLQRVLHCSLALRTANLGHNISALKTTLSQQHQQPHARGEAAANGTATAAPADAGSPPEELQFRHPKAQGTPTDDSMIASNVAGGSGEGEGSPSTSAPFSRLATLQQPPHPFATTDAGSPSLRIEEDEQAASAASVVRDAILRVRDAMRRSWELWQERMHTRAVQAEEYAAQEHRRYAQQQQVGGGYAAQDGPGTGLGHPPTPTPSIPSEDLVNAAISCRSRILQWAGRRRLQLEIDNEHLLPWVPRIYPQTDQSAEVLRELLLGSAVPLRETASIVRWCVRNQVNVLSKNRLKASIYKALGLEGALELFRYGRSSVEPYDPFSGSLLPAPPPEPPATPAILSLSGSREGDVSTPSFAPPTGPVPARGPGMGMPARQPHPANTGLGAITVLTTQLPREETAQTATADTDTSDKTAIVHSDTSINNVVADDSLESDVADLGATPVVAPVIRPADPVALAQEPLDSDGEDENLVIGAEDAEKERQMMASKVGPGLAGNLASSAGSLPPIPVVVGREVIGGSEAEERQAALALAKQLSGAKAPVAERQAATASGQPTQPPVPFFVKAPQVPSPGGPVQQQGQAQAPTQFDLVGGALKRPAGRGLLSVPQLLAYSESPVSSDEGDPERSGRWQQASYYHEQEGGPEGGAGGKRRKMRREPSQGGPSPAMVGRVGGNGSSEEGGSDWWRVARPQKGLVVGASGGNALGSAGFTRDFHLAPSYSFREVGPAFKTPSPPLLAVAPAAVASGSNGYGGLEQQERGESSTYIQQLQQQHHKRHKKREKEEARKSAAECQKAQAAEFDEEREAAATLGPSALGEAEWENEEGSPMPSAATRLRIEEAGGDSRRKGQPLQPYQIQGATGALQHGIALSYASAPPELTSLASSSQRNEFNLPAEHHRPAASAPDSSSVGKEAVGGGPDVSIAARMAAFAKGGVASRTVAYLEQGYGYGPHSGGDIGLHPSVGPAKGGAASVAATATGDKRMPTRAGPSDRNLTAAPKALRPSPLGPTASTPSHSSMHTFTAASIPSHGAVHPPHQHELHSELMGSDAGDADSEGAVSSGFSDRSGFESPSLADATKDTVMQAPEQKKKLRQLGLALSAYAVGEGYHDTMAMISAQGEHACPLHFRSDIPNLGHSGDMCPLCGVSPAEEEQERGRRKRSAKKKMKARIAEGDATVMGGAAVATGSIEEASAPYAPIQYQQDYQQASRPTKKSSGAILNIPAKLKNLFTRGSGGAQRGDQQQQQQQQQMPPRQPFQTSEQHSHRLQTVSESALNASRTRAGTAPGAMGGGAFHPPQAQGSSFTPPPSVGRVARAVSWPVDEASAVADMDDGFSVEGQHGAGAAGMVAVSRSSYRQRQRAVSEAEGEPARRPLTTGVQTPSRSAAPSGGGVPAPGAPAVAIVQEVRETGQVLDSGQRPQLTTDAIATGHPTTIAVVQTGVGPSTTHSRTTTLAGRLKALFGGKNTVPTAGTVSASAPAALTPPPTPPRGSPAGGFVAAASAPAALSSSSLSTLRRHQLAPSDSRGYNHGSEPRLVVGETGQEINEEDERRQQEEEDRRLLRPADSTGPGGPASIAGATSMFIRDPSDLDFLRSQRPGLQGVPEKAPRAGGRPYVDSDDSILSPEAQQDRQQERTRGQPRQPSSLPEETAEEGGMSLNAVSAAQMREQVARQLGQQEQETLLPTEPKKGRWRRSGFGKLCNCGSWFA